MTAREQRLGMILKGYPRISESFISTEILLLESLGIPIDIYSLRQPREDFSHDHIKEIRATATYLPEYVLPHWQTLWRSNMALRKRLGPHYTRCLAGAVQRAWERKKPATLRHFLQAGHLTEVRLLHDSVTHLHAHFCHTPTSVALFASELTGLPFSFTAHAKDVYISEPEQLVRKIKKARFVVTCTDYNARYLKNLAESAGVPYAPARHLPRHRREPLQLRPSSRSPATLSGPFHRPSRPQERIRHPAEVSEDYWIEAGLDFRFTHIGSGEMQSASYQDDSRSRSQHRVKLLGTLPHGEVIRHYRQAHCFALASQGGAQRRPGRHPQCAHRGHGHRGAGGGDKGFGHSGTG